MFNNWVKLIFLELRWWIRLWKEHSSVSSVWVELWYLSRLSNISIHGMGAWCAWFILLSSWCPVKPCDISGWTPWVDPQINARCSMESLGLSRLHLWFWNIEPIQIKMLECWNWNVGILILDQFWFCKFIQRTPEDGAIFTEIFFFSMKSLSVCCMKIQAVFRYIIHIVAFNS